MFLRSVPGVGGEPRFPLPRWPAVRHRSPVARCAALRCPVAPLGCPTASRHSVVNWPATEPFRSPSSATVLMPTTLPTAPLTYNQYYIPGSRRQVKLYFKAVFLNDSAYFGCLRPDERTSRIARSSRPRRPPSRPVAAVLARFAPRSAGRPGTSGARPPRATTGSARRLFPPLYTPSEGAAPTACPWVSIRILRMCSLAAAHGMPMPITVSSCVW